MCGNAMARLLRLLGRCSGIILEHNKCVKLECAVFVFCKKLIEDAPRKCWWAANRWHMFSNIGGWVYGENQFVRHETSTTST
ncbi:hypothetical protein L208DRAFT_1409410 [Tricholoma matsutake]|nr:hypothetical protein L208DRAFT_1409410 [Tricholoma matsutake 945]